MQMVAVAHKLVFFQFYCKIGVIPLDFQQLLARRFGETYELVEGQV